MLRRLLLTLALTGWSVAQPVPPLPYRAAGLDERQAARFLLQRLTFGATPGQLDQVVQTGLEKWVEAQLDGQASEEELSQRLQDTPCLAMEAGEERTTYVSRARMQELAEQDSLRKWTEGSERSRQIYEARLRDYKESNGIASYDDLFDEIRYQKLLRCRYAHNQLREVLTDFWFNHFNVAALNDNVRVNVLSYERDILRPQALGSFPAMLHQTSQHPAMLYYLDNAQSSASPGAQTTLNARYKSAPAEDQEELRQGQPLQRKNGGLNENYAREVMELHTLGVDGGYTQKDVTELARCLSGWTVLYPEANNDNLRALIKPGQRLGYEQRGDFLFRADWHDAESKSFLGHSFEPGGGLEEGERALDILAAHPSTARYLARKLAQRFVSDEAPAALVDRMARAYGQSHGEIRPMLVAMLQSPEFWAEAAHPSKVKSPLEFFVSSLRCCDADLQFERGHFYWLQRLGQPLYACVPPTGYPEDSRVWASTSELVNRMNFATQLSQNRIKGIRVDWGRFLRPGQEPGAALQPLVVAEAGALAEQLSAKKLLNGGDGYVPERKWFRNPKPADYEQRRRQVWATKVAGVLLASPAFQYR
ncbi:DUF1800 domain-containing protein [bacterium]|nr:DUF1800 domain-containing protein [bacterium]